MIYRRHDGVAVPVYERIQKYHKIPIVKDGVLFCSDLHLGHDMAADLRGFKSVVEHDESIIRMLEKQCDKRTLLFVLGDVAMKLEPLIQLGQRLKHVRKKMIFGNHDIFDTAFYADVFQELHGFMKYKKMWLSHCPIHESEFYSKVLNVHGHVHFQKGGSGEETMKLPLPYFNVNWDMWGRAVSLTEIRTLIPGEEK